MEKIIYKLPDEFRERLKSIYPADYIPVLRSFIREKDTCFRVNAIKNSREELINLLKAERIPFKAVGWYKQAFLLQKMSQRDFQKSSVYKDSHIYLQNLSSMVPVIILGPKRDEKILDLCAAPGSKTTQIVSLTEGKSLVTAVEKIKPRFYKLAANLKKQGQVKYVDLKLADGTKVWRRYQDYFDRVLVDAPCSSEANFSLHRPKTYQYWSYRKVKESQHKQKKLLYSGIMALKPGGRLVYSTCTFSPEENEEVVNWALGKFSDEISLIEINLGLPNIKNGLTAWHGRVFSEKLTYTKRILPTDQMEGFFVAAFDKS